MVGEQEGGADDFDTAFRELFDPAFRVAYRILGDVDDAEDAAAEALARALVAWARVGRLSYRDAWVMRVAANVAVDTVRRRRTEPFAEIAGEDQAETTLLRLSLAAALVRLSKRQREVVALRYIGGLSEADVAAALGVSLNSVKKHMQRGVASLRDRLGSEWREGESVAD